MNFADHRAGARTAILEAGMYGAGAVGLLMAYWVWRGVLGVPFELASPGVKLDRAFEAVRPWAPWWVLPTLMTLASMAIWRALAWREDGISLRGAATVGVVIIPLALVLGAFCLQVGTIAQYVPTPPLAKIIGLLPRMLSECVSSAFVGLMFHGMVVVPASVLLMLVVAAATRLLLRTAG
jgi:Na+/proline symporter